MLEQIKGENLDFKSVITSDFHALSTKIRKVVKNKGIKSVYTSRGSLGDHIINLKDKSPNEMKSGIYQISCDTCKRKYVGQTTRRVRERFKEHERACRLKKPSDSAVADHVLESKHNVGEKRVIKEVTNPFELNAWESFFISNTENPFNLEEEPIRSQLFKIAHNFSG